MIKAQIMEKYIRSASGSPKNGIETIIHEERFFSTREKFNEWVDSFKDQLWEDDPSKVKMVEGVYVTSQELEVDNMDKPKRMVMHATFRNGVSYKYAC